MSMASAQKPISWRALIALLLCLGGISAAAQAQSPSAAIPEPAYWRLHFVEEPILGSRMRVLRVGDRNKPALVLVHGLGQNGLRDWQALIEHLRDDFYIIAPDLPGFGQSRTESGRLSPENFARVLQWLIRDEGLQNVHLVGHSMGGAVALYYAALYPQTLSKLTLIDAAGILHRSAFVKSMADVDRRHYSFLPEALQRPAARLLNFGNRMVEQVNLLPDLSQPLQQSDLAWNHLLGDQPNMNAALSLINTDFSYIPGAVQTPTLILWGALDPVAPLRTGHALRGLLPAAELKTIPDAEHLPIKTHSQLVAGFIRGHDVAHTNSHPTEHDTALDEAPILHCQGRTGLHYSGRYSHVLLHNCLDITLTDVQTQSIEMIDSEADFLRLQVNGSSTGIKAVRSSLRLTDTDIKADTALHIDGSRLDMAAVRLQAGQAAIQVLSPSVIIASLSEVHTALYAGKLHGAVRAKELRAEMLSALRSAAAPLERN